MGNIGGTGDVVASQRRIYIAFLSLVRTRHLLFELSKREITDRYASQALGWTWAVIHPVAFICVYIFLFAIVFQVRVPDSDNFPFNYTVFLLSGLVVWLFTQDCLVRSTTAIRANSALVKQSSFPMHLVVLKTVLGSSVTLIISLSVVIAYTLMAYGYVPMGYALIPALLVVVLVGVVGLSFALAAIGVFLRDLKDVVSILAFIGTFTLPIFYLPDMVPDRLRFVMTLNPFTYWIQMAQDTLYYGEVLHPIGWFIGALFSATCLPVGLWLFNRLRPSFGNEL